MNTDHKLPPTDAQVNAIRQRVLTAIATRPRKRLRQRILLLGTAALVAGATSAGVVAVQIASIDSRNTSFDCYTTTNLDDAHSTSMLADDDRQRTMELPLSERAQRAIEMCGASYRAVPTAGELEPVQVPHPTACVLRDGRIAVFPNAQHLAPAALCRELGLIAPEMG